MIRMTHHPLDKNQSNAIIDEPQSTIRVGMQALVSRRIFSSVLKICLPDQPGLMNKCLRLYQIEGVYAYLAHASIGSCSRTCAACLLKPVSPDQDVNTPV